MTQEDGLAGGKTPSDHARQGPDETGVAGPESADRESIGRGGAPTGAADSDAGNASDPPEEATELHEQIIETARRMVEDSPQDQVSGEEIAREVGVEPDNPSLHQALTLGAERGEIACQGWHGEGGLPTRVHAGAQPGAVSRD